MKSTHKFSFGLFGAIASAIVTSGALLIPACCAGPILFAALGVGAASLTRFEALFAYRWLLFGLILLFVATAFQQTYFSSKPVTCDTHTGTTRLRKILFWISMILILTLVSFPYVFEKVLLRLR